MINSYLAPDAKVKFALVLLPTGPEGRKTAINGLSDAISARTEHQEEAWKWVKSFGSADCQNAVGTSGVMFPTITAAGDKALAAHKSTGKDVQVIVDEAMAADGTFFLPVSEQGNEIIQIMQDAIQSTVLGQSDSATALKKANDQVNALFK
jgi:multiple sugar transport system substrate-binding protein